MAVFGFCRTKTAPSQIDGAQVVSLGQTFDGQFVHRAVHTMSQVLRTPGMGDWFTGADIVLARNLEMFAVAAVARALHAPGASLTYECIDIHRLMLSRNLAGRLLRLIERTLLNRSQMLIVSSPAFLEAYFQPFQRLNDQSGPPALLLENKVVDPVLRCIEMGPPRRPGPPWRIGWFGMLRCRRSFELLRELAFRLGDTVEVVLAGRPSHRELPDFENRVAQTPGFSFLGEYEPDDVGKLYRDVHFAWGIDYFQQGGNSEWLLPNRVYECGRHGGVPVALRSTETGRWLDNRQLGLVVQDPVQDLEDFLRRLDAGAYLQLEARSRQAPRDWFAASEDECHDLLHALAAA